MRTKVLGMALATLVLTASAYADAVFTMGNHKQPNEENVLFKTSQMSITIDGFTNRSDTMVQFSSTTDILLAKSGQADIDAQDGFINNITITVPRRTFLDLIINPFKPASNNDLMLTVTMSDGKTFTTTYGRTNGNNFMTITTTGGKMISSVTIDSATGFEDLKQPRISGISGVTLVPEPSSMFLLGSGLVGLMGLMRRKINVYRIWTFEDRGFASFSS